MEDLRNSGHRPCVRCFASEFSPFVDVEVLEEVSFFTRDPGATVAYADVIERGININHQFTLDIRTMVHELAHHYDITDRDRKFKRFSWEPEGRWSWLNKFFWTKKENQSVSHFADYYGMTDPYEDYATTVESYVFDSSKESKRVDFLPKYDFVRKNIFNGQEYNVYDGFDDFMVFYKSGVFESLISSCLNAIYPTKKNLNFQSDFTYWIKTDPCVQSFIEKNLLKKYENTPLSCGKTQEQSIASIHKKIDEMFNEVFAVLKNLSDGSVCTEADRAACEKE